MKIKVLKRFHDKETDQVYNAGEIVEVTEKRAKEIVSSPLEVAELLEAEKPVETETPVEPVPAAKPKATRKRK